MIKITLGHYLSEQSKLPLEQRIPEDKIKLLKLAAKFADEVKRITKAPRNHVWEFVFYGGTFEGNTHIQIKAKQLSAIDLLYAIRTEKPGLAWKCEKAILEIMENEPNDKS